VTQYVLIWQNDLLVTTYTTYCKGIHLKILLTIFEQWFEYFSVPYVVLKSKIEINEINEINETNYIFAFQHDHGVLPK